MDKADLFTVICLPKYYATFPTVIIRTPYADWAESVHFVTVPFAADIKGAVLQVQDCERYNCNYRNGFYKMGLTGG